MSERLFAGAGSAVITPPLGTHLMGYSPTRPAESIGDDLTTDAIALRYGERSALLITVHVGVLENCKYDSIRKLVSEATGVPYESIIICTTHTHSAPCTGTVHGWNEVNLEYYDAILEPGIVSAAKQAVDALTPVRTGIGVVQSDVAINRRQLNRDGSISLGQNPWAPYDPNMTVISFRGDDGKTVANIIHYSAHGTGAGYSPEVTRDWPGPMVDALTELTGAVTAFFNGAIGDTGPRLTNGGTTGNYKLAMQLGAKAAIDAVRAWRSIKDYTDLDFDYATGEIRLPNEPLPPREELCEALKNYPHPETLVGMPMAEYHSYSAQLAEYDSGKPLQTHYCYNQTILRIGPAVFVPFHHEIFTEIAMRLRAYSPYQYTLSLTNANGACAYFPSRDQICRKGYEIEARKLINTYILAPEADEAVINQNLEIIEKL